MIVCQKGKGSLTSSSTCFGHLSEDGHERSEVSSTSDALRTWALAHDERV